jgi:hypothetical protein
MGNQISPTAPCVIFPEVKDNLGLHGLQGGRVPVGACALAYRASMIVGAVHIDLVMTRLTLSDAVSDRIAVSKTMESMNANAGRRERTGTAPGHKKTRLQECGRE